MELPSLFHMIFSKLGYDRLPHRVTMMLGETGEIFEQQWALSSRSISGHSTIASKLMKTPVDIRVIIRELETGIPEID